MLVPPGLFQAREIMNLKSLSELILQPLGDHFKGIQTHGVSHLELMISQIHAESLQSVAAGARPLDRNHCVLCAMDKNEGLVPYLRFIDFQIYVTRDIA